MNVLNVVLILLAYLAYAAFWTRVFSHGLLWLKAAGQYRTYQPGDTAASPRACVVTALDLLLFRRLFATDKIVWSGSWLFHVSIFFVLLRHLRYFMQPVPDCITALHPFGVFAGYVLPVSLFGLLAVRLLSGKKRYVSLANYGILSMVLVISVSGVLMRNFYESDLPGVKAFIIGILALSPQPAPSGILFVLHFSLALLLVPFIPSHIFAAPFVSFEARRRDEGLGMIMHEK